MPPKAAPRSQETDLQEKDTAERERRQEEVTTPSSSVCLCDLSTLESDHRDSDREIKNQKIKLI